MQISQDLPQFSNIPTLLVTAGDQTAKFFHAHDGTIEELDSFVIENPNYSDTEGHFKRQSGGETLGSGSVLEENKQAVKNKFYHQLQERLDTILAEHPFDEIILLAPPHSIKDTEEHMQPKFRDKIDQRVKGNFTKDRPLALLRRLE